MYLFFRKEICMLLYFNLCLKHRNLPSSPLLPAVTSKIIITTGHVVTALQSRSNISISCVVSQIYLLLTPFSLLGLITCHLITVKFKQKTALELTLVHPQFGVLPLKKKRV